MVPGTARNIIDKIVSCNLFFSNLAEIVPDEFSFDLIGPFFYYAWTGENSPGRQTGCGIKAFPFSAEFYKNRALLPAVYVKIKLCQAALPDEQR